MKYAICCFGKLPICNGMAKVIESRIKKNERVFFHLGWMQFWDVSWFPRDGFTPDKKLCPYFFLETSVTHLWCPIWNLSVNELQKGLYLTETCRSKPLYSISCKLYIINNEIKNLHWSLFSSVMNLPLKRIYRPEDALLCLLKTSFLITIIFMKLMRFSYHI